MWAVTTNEPTPFEGFEGHQVKILFHFPPLEPGSILLLWGSGAGPWLLHSPDGGQISAARVGDAGREKGDVPPTLGARIVPAAGRSGWRRCLSGNY